MNSAEIFLKKKKFFIKKLNDMFNDGNQTAGDILKFIYIFDQ